MYSEVVCVCCVVLRVICMEWRMLCKFCVLWCVLCVLTVLWNTVRAVATDLINMAHAILEKMLVYLRNIWYINILTSSMG